MLRLASLCSRGELANNMSSHPKCHYIETLGETTTSFYFASMGKFLDHSDDWNPNLKCPNCLRDWTYIRIHLSWLGVKKVSYSQTSIGLHIDGLPCKHGITPYTVLLKLQISGNPIYFLHPLMLYSLIWLLLHWLNLMWLTLIATSLIYLNLLLEYIICTW